jgi:arylsulfatase A-like enzyme
MAPMGWWLSVWLGVGVSAAEPTNLILISMDTTRADALSCDEGALPGLASKPPSITPVLDEQAAKGVRFSQFWANAPTTLNSHATMMTGLDPHGHAVVRNGSPLDMGLYTLAERLGEAGYDTMGVVGAAALERAMQLHQGFRIYDDAAEELHGIMYQQRADGVVDRALAAVAERDKAKPSFLFVHFYDPHSPYDPPVPWDERFTDAEYQGPYRVERGKTGRLQRAIEDGTADPADLAYMSGLYLGEVAFMDDQIGRLLRGLEAEGLLERALVILTADHGEVLSEDPIYAYSHGTDVGDGAMRIPLIVRGHGLSLPAGRVVSRQASLAGLAPTIERALGLDIRLGERRDFWDYLRPGPVRWEEGWPEVATEPIYMEATRPRQYEPESGWNNLTFYRSVRAGGYSMAGAPVFDLPYVMKPPHEEEEGVLLWLRALMARWDRLAPSERVDAPMAPATKRALEVLGYLEE